MNKYSSVERRHWARNVYETVIPAASGDITLDKTLFIPQVIPNSFTIEPDSNIVIKRVGLFSNFADGLVFKNANDMLTMGITIRSVYYSAIPGGTQNLTAGSKAVTGTLLDVNFSADDFIQDIPSKNIYQIDTVTDAANMSLKNYAYKNTTSIAKYSTIGLDTIDDRIEFRTLNDMYEIDEFLSPIIFGAGVNVPVNVIIQPTFDADTTDLVFLTKSINSDFEEDAVFFDVAFDIEYTPA